MNHPAELSPQDKFQAWLDLCDLTLRLMEAALDPPRLEDRFRRMREEDIRGHRKVLRRLGELSR